MITTNNEQQLVSSLTRLDLTKKEKLLLFFICSEAVESKLVNLETSRTVMLPLKMSVLCGQSYKGPMIANYDSRVVPDLKIPNITTLMS